MITKSTVAVSRAHLVVHQGDGVRKPVPLPRLDVLPQPADEAVDAALRRRAREGLAHRAEVGPEPSLLHLRFNTFPTNIIYF